MSDIHEYSDIIHMKHHISIKHPQISLEKRSAQFAPFSALAGHKESIDESERYTEQKRTLDSDQIAIINKKLIEIKDNLHNYDQIKVTYFVKDKKKSGGKYLTLTGCIKKIDNYANILIFENGCKINIQDIYDIE